MLDEEQVRAYADADFEAPHNHFIELLAARFQRLPQKGLALDLGCGSGDICRRYAAQFPGWRIDGIDGSDAFGDSCALGYENCSDEEGCAFHREWKALREQYQRTIGSLSLSDAAKSANASEAPQ